MTSSEVAFAAFEDALDDVHSRFILNLPENELSSADRIFFQLEQAHWYYEVRNCVCLRTFVLEGRGGGSMRNPVALVSKTKTFAFEFNGSASVYSTGHALLGHLSTLLPFFAH